jgi:SCP-2 sterol transfer family protein
MPRYLSPEWVQQFDAALSALDLGEAITDAGRDSVTAGQGTFAVAQEVPDAPGGPVRTVLSVDDGRVSLQMDPDGALAVNVTMVLGYDDALAMANGELEPADALAAGRVRVRGELAVLVAAQVVLGAAAAALGLTLSALTTPTEDAG